MRKVAASTFVSLDGVMQAPGGPQEDTSGGFVHGGWVFPYWDDVLDKAMGGLFSRPFELLLGRRTYDIFAAHWPHIDVDPASSTYDEPNAAIANLFNSVPKHVASRTRRELSWRNSSWLGEDAAAGVRELKKGDGADLLVQGSGDFMQTLLEADLVDEIRLLVFPLTLGKGKRLFAGGTLPAAFTLTHSIASPSGVLIATYERAGAVRTGSFALEAPADASS